MKIFPKQVFPISIVAVFLLFLPAAASAFTVEQMMAGLNALNGRIRSINADFSMRTSGTGETNVQRGNYSWSTETGTVMRYESPVKMTMELKPNGEVLVNGEKKRNISSPIQNGDLFFIDFLSRFRLQVAAEDTNFVTLSGFDKSSRLINKKLLTARFNRNIGVIDRLEYRGSGKDYPYELEISYTNMSGIPMTESLSTRMSAFSVTVTSVFRYENIRLETR